jgi:cell division protein ZapA (FtsZ GTPase activity inhibitor)
MDELTISVNIADRPYRITINRSEEENIRKATLEINNSLKKYSENYAYHDKQDLLAMVALERTTKMMDELGKAEISKSILTEKLTKIDNLLTKSLTGI